MQNVAAFYLVNSAQELTDEKIKNTHSALSIFRLIPIKLSTGAEIIDYYDNYSAAMSNHTYYRFTVDHNTQDGYLGGGCWYVEGFKATNDYEWQMARVYVSINRHPIQYRVKNVNWLSWENIV